MNSRILVYCILLSILVPFLLSTTAESTEYREANTKVKAEEILKHIENGDDVYFSNCSIVGDLDLSKIELEIVPSPVFDKLIKEENSIEEVKDCGVTEGSKVIVSNITIENSVFENNINFSNSLFKNRVSFSGTSFNDVDFRGVSFSDNTTFEDANFGGFSLFCLANFGNDTSFIGTKFSTGAIFGFSSFGNNTNFYRTYFGNSANFVRTTFDYYTVFSETTFGDNASFEKAEFGDYAIFAFANFGNSTVFLFDNFGDNAIFEEANFGTSSNFGRTQFQGSVTFEGAKFGDSTDFVTADFNETAEFIGPDTPENIIVDGEAYEVFRNGYENQARYEDADSIYYNYRRMHQKNKSFTSLSKWMDIISWISCGYGLRPSYTLYLGGVLVVVFSIIYVKCPSVSFSSSNDKKISLRFYFKDPGIVMRTENFENQPKHVSFWDALNFSITTFTTVGYGNWYPKENFKKWATLEGLLGWIILGVFMSTLTAVMIRP